MSTRIVSTALVITTTFMLTPSAAKACWLTDHLYGRAPVAPNAAGYAAPGAAGYAAGYPAAAGVAAPALTQPYTAGYAGYGYGYMSTVAPSLSLPGVPQNGAAALQRPAYPENPYASNFAPLDNPSVYTGLPVDVEPDVPDQPVAVARPPGTLPIAPRRYQAYSAPLSGTVPIARRLRGAAATSNSFYGTGNVYPNNYQVPAYASNYPGTAAAGAVPPAPAAIPAAGLPTATMPVAGAYAAPVSPAPRHPVLSGLRRFFGSLLGKHYESSYYRAPVTYYRPVTTVDPVTGTDVTVQRPCASSVQMLQRTPYRSLQTPPPSLAPSLPPSTFEPATTAPLCGPVPAAKLDCSPECADDPGFADSYQPTPVYPPATSVPSAVDQSGAIGSPSDQFVSPIPSTEGMGRGGVSSGDREQVEQPRLQSARPRQDGSSVLHEEPPVRSQQTPSATWRLSPPENSSERQPAPVAEQPSSAAEQDATTTGRTRQPTSSPVRRYTNVRPIPAPDNYRSPLDRSRSPSQARDETAVSDSHEESSAERSPLVAPPLPAKRWRIEPYDADPEAKVTGTSQRDPWLPSAAPAREPQLPAASESQTPAREASLMRAHTVSKPAATAPVQPIQTNDESGWYSVR